MIGYRQRVFIVSLLLLAACGGIFTVFLHFHEIRVDALKWYFDDPAFDWLPAYDCSLLILLVTYGSVLSFGITQFNTPFALSRLAASYAVLLIFRIGSLALVPLKEPESIIFLNDPFLNTFIYQGELNGDLFFSGHTGLLFLIYYVSGRKWYFLLTGCILGVLLVIQRVHYSIDILAAIPVAWFTAYLVDKAFSRWVTEKNG